MQRTETAQVARPNSLLDLISSILAHAISDLIFDWGSPVLRAFYAVHTDDHTRIVGIDPHGKEVVLQGFNYSKMVPGLVESCLEAHRLERPDCLVGVVNLRTGEVDWS